MDSIDKYTEIGIPQDWVEVIQKAGYNEIAELIDVNPNKLHQVICGLNKKYALGLTNPTPDDVKLWVENVSR